MKICALELPASFGDPAGRLADLGRALAGGPDADAELVVLPECALTGYVSTDLDFDLRRFAEPLDGPTLQAYRALARDRRIVLAGPLVEAGDGGVFNSFVVVDGRVDGGDELLAHYRKRHPWFPETWATPGSLPYPDLSIGGLRVTLALCFDVHFLAREAAATLSAADVLLFPSAWVDDDRTDLRGDIFAGLVRRFGLTVVNANWGHGEPAVPGQGRSRIAGVTGVVEARRRAGEIPRATAEVLPKSRPR